MSTEAEAKDTPPASPKEGASKNNSFRNGVIIGALCVLGINGAVSGPEDRYPIREEYEIAKACIDGSGGFLPRDSYLAKQERCLCALEKTMKEIPYNEYQKSAAEFTATFRKIAPTCTNKGRS